MSKETEFNEFVAAKAEELGVPGVAAGIFVDGDEQYAFHGVTSIENPLDVDENTLFQFGSTGKTYTAVAILRLVERGDVELDATVRTYIPELKLKDEDVAAKVTVRHLLNHTAGWAGDVMENTGDGDDALAVYVANLAEVEQVSPLGESVSYNNAALSVAGRIIEKITGKTYEQSMKEVVFEPLGLTQTFFFPNEIMTRRFAVGHNQKPDGTVKIARPWALARGNTPAGGMSSNAAEQIAWARFHLGDGTARDGSRVLSEELLKEMQEPTMQTPGNAVGDAIGLSWWLRDIEGVRLVGHGGTTNGQHSAFDMVPERDFALISLTNCGPNGPQLNDELLKWALHEYLGIVVTDPEPISVGDAELLQYVGSYETIAAIAHVEAKDGALELKVDYKPETLAQLREAGEDLPGEEERTFLAGLLPGDGDRYIITDGPAKGMKGYFVKDSSGEIEAIHVGGRLATRMKTPASTG